jgi:hypothetical protein
MYRIVTDETTGSRSLLIPNIWEDCLKIGVTEIGCKEPNGVGEGLRLCDVTTLLNREPENN